MNICKCDIRDRENDETQREWLKDTMCMYHWMQTDYYQAKFDTEEKKDEDTDPHTE